MNKFKFYLSLGLCSWGSVISAQEKLSKEEAVEIALKNNFDIQVSSNFVKIAENNASIYNSNYLPTLGVNAGANYNDNNNKTTFFAQPDLENNTQVTNYNASVGLGYTLFDGFGRKYNYKRLQELSNLSEIQARQVMETALLELLSGYYEVARLTENRYNQNRSLEISKDRLTREKYRYQYGQSTQLNVLNSEVDVNNDSITYLDLDRQLANTKRDLNLVLGRDISVDFEVDTTVNYVLELNYENLLKASKENNVQLQQAEKNVKISGYDLRINRSGWMPDLLLSSSYGWNDNEFETDRFNNFSVRSQNTLGFAAGLSLNWNIFDGGRTRTLVQNAKINIDNAEVEKERVEKLVERNVANAWETYQNALFILQAEQKNVETNKRNFSRSEEQFKLGQINSVDFRLAQINLLNAVNNYNRAKYAAKVAELFLLQLSGQLLGTTY